MMMIIIIIIINSRSWDSLVRINVRLLAGLSDARIILMVVNNNNNNNNNTPSQCVCPWTVHWRPLQKQARRVTL